MLAYVVVTVGLEETIGHYPATCGGAVQLTAVAHFFEAVGFWMNSRVWKTGLSYLLKRHHPNVTARVAQPPLP